MENVQINKITREDVRQFKYHLKDSETQASYNVADLYQEIAGQSAVYFGRNTVMGLVYCTLAINGEAGELAEHVKKALRDENLVSFSRKHEADEDGPAEDVFSAFEASYALTPERAEKIDKEIGDLMWYVARLAAERGKKLSDVMLENLEKLADRTERNTLRGSGDDR